MLSLALNLSFHSVKWRYCALQIISRIGNNICDTRGVQQEGEVYLMTGLVLLVFEGLLRDTIHAVKRFMNIGGGANL